MELPIGRFCTIEAPVTAAVSATAADGERFWVLGATNLRSWNVRAALGALRSTFSGALERSGLLRLAGADSTTTIPGFWATGEETA
ncbi:MAG: hypothetical protein V1791_09910 [Pseudomonadota bacterium]